MPSTRTRSKFNTLSCVADSRGYTPALKELSDALQTDDGMRLLQAAYIANMSNKSERYKTMIHRAQEDVTREERLIDEKMPDLKRKAEATPHDNWAIFETVSRKYIEARDNLAAFEVIQRDAQDNVVKLNDDVAVRELRDELVLALEALTNFSAQAAIVDAAVGIVSQFVKNPSLVRTKFLNFVLVGAAGTGKTTLVHAIARVFAKAGIFVYNRVREAGRADLVGEYEGQTVARTRAFLLASLECTIFIDEAYALTTWSNGKPECYGSEATTALLHHMTKYKGCYALFVAGYEKEMLRYFLPVNPGLQRRFPFRFKLNNLTSDELTTVFQRSLLLELGAELPEGRQAQLASVGFFTSQAWAWLKNLISAATSGENVMMAEWEFDEATRTSYPPERIFRPLYPYMFELFKNQAGSMTNLAEEAASVLARSVSFASASTQARRRRRSGWTLEIEMQDVEIMRRVIQSRINHTAMSQTDTFFAELEHIESRFAFP